MPPRNHRATRGPELLVREPHAEFLRRLHAAPKTVRASSVLAELMPDKDAAAIRKQLSCWRKEVPGFQGSYEAAQEGRVGYRTPPAEMAAKCEEVLRLVHDEDYTWSSAFAEVGMNPGTFHNRVERDPELSRRVDMVRLSKDYQYVDQIDKMVLRTASEIEQSGDDFRRGSTVINGVKIRANAAARVGRSTPLQDFVDARHVEQRVHDTGLEQLGAVLSYIRDHLLPPAPQPGEKEEYDVIEVDAESGEWTGQPKELTA